ncbi:hypothetical protein niasHT_006035 [Heterodera trifolii]|uniref:Uncharacterized protein n=1 Tax=Heterodera trifolii TaxID=157864 RepID=A0ABD2MDE8_9BILA
MNYPTNFSWLPVNNCVCPVKDNLCYQFPGYKKPVICAHKLVNNITTFLSNPPHIPNESASASFSSGSVLQLLTVLQIFIILLTVALCCCLLVCAVRGRIYTVNGRRSARRRAAAATLSAFQARTSALGLGIAGPLAVPNRPAGSTSHRVPG